MRYYPTIDLQEIPLEDLQPDNNMLQSPFWGRFKEKQGWKPLAIRYTWEDHGGTLLILVRKLFRFLPIAYVPFGPALPEENPEIFLNALSWGLVSVLPMGTLFIRYDINQGNSEDALLARKEASNEESRRTSLKLDRPLWKARQDVQPPDTVILDLTPGENEILAGMHKKWRYNIRLAEKKGVEVTIEARGDLSQWYDLYRVTSERDRIALHPKSYYQRLFDLSGEFKEKKQPAPELYLLQAKHEQDLLAGIIVSIFEKRATYLYGASSNEKRNLMPAYALQWQAIKLAMEKGCSEYDFFGLPPTSDESHPMHGLFLFKTGFGGKIHHNLGCWDYPYSKVFYHLYRLVESFRIWYFKVFKKRKR